MAEVPSAELHQRWAKTQETARLLIESKPWLDRSDWAAGRIVHDPDSGSFISYLLIGFCLIAAVVGVLSAYATKQWETLFVSAFFIAVTAPLIYMRFRARYGKAECLLRTVPARIGGTFEANIKARWLASRDAEVHVWLANEQRGRTTGGSLWITEQRIAPRDIQIAADGTWTFPVRIALPPTLRAQALTRDWALRLKVKNAGADFWARFDVPVFDLADLPYDEDQPRPRWAPPYATVGFRLADLSYGALVGTLIGFALGFSAAGHTRLERLFGTVSRIAEGSRATRHTGIEGLFLGPFGVALFAFAFLGFWRAAAATALRDRKRPEREAEARARLMLLTLVPWAAAAIVLWFAWAVLPFAGLVWGLGMMLCAHPSTFGWFWRDPLFRSGAVLALCSLFLFDRFPI